MALRCVVYFRICGWRHVFIPRVLNIKTTAAFRQVHQSVAPEAKSAIYDCYVYVGFCFCCQEIGREEHFHCDLFCVEWDITTPTRSHPEMVGDMSRVTLNIDLSKIPFVHFQPGQDLYSHQKLNMYIYWFSSGSGYRRRRQQCGTPQYNH